MMLCAPSWEGRVMGTGAYLSVATDDPEAGRAALLRAVEDLAATERALSRFRGSSELSRLNRSGTVDAGERLLAALTTAIEAYEWSDGLLDPRVIDPSKGSATARPSLRMMSERSSRRRL